MHSIHYAHLKMSFLGGVIWGLTLGAKKVISSNWARVSSWIKLKQRSWSFSTSKLKSEIFIPMPCGCSAFYTMLKKLWSWKFVKNLIGQVIFIADIERTNFRYLIQNYSCSPFLFVENHLENFIEMFEGTQLNFGWFMLRSMLSSWRIFSQPKFESYELASRFPRFKSGQCCQDLITSIIVPLDL